MKEEVDLNTQVEIEMTYTSGEQQVMNFDLVTDDQADFYAGFLGVSTPLAQAILGQRLGTSVPYPVGDVTEVKILSICPSSRQAPSDKAAQRERVIRQAVAESELKNRLAVATAVD
jgi:hypothetical protein